MGDAPKGDVRGFGLTGFAGLVVVFLLFPWVEVSCAGQPLISQAGYQVVIGSGSLPGGAEDAKSPANDALEKERQKGESIAAWWLLLALAGTGTAGYFGVRMTKSAAERAARAKPAALASLVGAAILSASLVVGLPLERRVGDAQAKMQAEARENDGGIQRLGSALGAAIRAERKTGAWLTLLAMWGQVGLAAYLAFAAKLSSAPARAEAPRDASDPGG